MKKQVIVVAASLALGTILGWSVGSTRGRAESGRAEAKEAAGGHGHGREEHDPHGEDEHGEGGEEAGHGEHGGEEGSEPGVIADSILAEAGIALDTALPGVLAEVLVLPGSVRHDPSRASKVAARFPGVVRTWTPRIGDAVRQGDLLGTVESDATLEPYQLRAARGGTVVRMDASAGQAVDAGRILAEIVDLDAVAVDLKAGGRDLSRVRRGQAVTVRLDGGEAGARGRVAAVLPGVDLATQTRTVRLVVANPRRQLAEGQFVEGLVEVGDVAARVVVPRASVQSAKGRDVVYVRAADRFEERRVVLGRKDAARVEVLSGLKPGEVVAAEGSFVVKADLGKSEAGHEH